MMFVKYPLLPWDVMEQNTITTQEQKEKNRFVCMLLIEQTTGVHANKQDKKGV